MEFRSESLTLTTAEYALIAGVLGAGTLLGIDDPFAGVLAEDLRARLDETLDGLVARGLAEVRADRRVIFEQQVGFAVAVCAFPEAAFVLTRTRPDGAGEQRHYHVTRQGTVEMVHPQGPDLPLLLTFLPGPAQVLERVLELTGLDGQPGADLLSGEVPAEVVGAARAAAAANGAEAARPMLEACGLPGQTAAALAETLARPVMNASLVSLTPRGAQWQTGGVGLLLGENAVWRLGSVERDGVPLVTVCPVAAAELQGELAQVISAALPFAATGV